MYRKWDYVWSNNEQQTPGTCSGSSYIPNIIGKHTQIINIQV